MTEFVSGAVSTVTDLGKDEAWMQGWLKDQPNRLGLGELEVAEGANDDGRSFVATDDDRCFSVDVQLGEMEASRGFEVLDDWARNRVLHPDKAHIAVIVAEAMSDRYQTTLETLAEHLPLVVVELQVWKGENEAIVVPHIALSSDEVDLADMPAAKAAKAVAKTADSGGSETKAEVEDVPEVVSEAEDVPEAEAGEVSEVVSEAEAVAAEADAQADAEVEADEPTNKDDTGVGNPWGLPADDKIKASPDGSTGLLTKVGN